MGRIKSPSSISSNAPTPLIALAAILPEHPQEGWIDVEAELVMWSDGYREVYTVA